MFTIISFKEDGAIIEIANQDPAFYGLYYNGALVDYYTTMSALKDSVSDIERGLLFESDTVITDFKEVA